jgi:hypothetical protein
MNSLQTRHFKTRDIPVMAEVEIRLKVAEEEGAEAVMSAVEEY